VVLPEAEGERDAEDGDRDNDAAAQLVEVLDERELILVGDRLDAAHRFASGPRPDGGVLGLRHGAMDRRRLKRGRCVWL
jgi:hypothetical protein